MRIPILSLLALSLVAGCGGGKKSSPPRTVFGGDRPVTLQIPASYDGTTPMPLLLITHGYGATGAIQEGYMGLGALVNSPGVFILAPNGLTDSLGNRFWNATDGCCNFDANPVDDVAYLKGLIADVRHDYKIDPKRIYQLGHSNGAFMAHRMACDDSDDLAAIVSLAGATWLDPAKCAPTGHVSILDIHGDADTTIPYNGGQNTGLGAFPGEAVTMDRWQGYDGCTPGIVVDSSLTIDIDGAIPGNETTAKRYAGCPAGIGVELWTIVGGPHVPSPLAADFPATVWTWLAAHPKP